MFIYTASALAIALSAYMTVTVLLYAFQRKLMYHPESNLPSPEDEGLQGVEAVAIAGHDGIPLHCWWAPPPEGGFTVLHFHGNAGDLTHRADRLKLLKNMGFGVLLAGYRYNGGSGGKPSEEAIIADAKMVFDWLVRHVPADRIILYGESLGTGVALALAAEGKGRAVVLEAPYSSIADVAASRYPLIPVRRLMKDGFDSMSRIQRVKVPVLILHGTDDRVIPIRFARRLKAGSGQQAVMHEYEGGGHTDLFDIPNGATADLAAFLNSVTGKTGQISPEASSNLERAADKASGVSTSIIGPSLPTGTSSTASE